MLLILLSLLLLLLCCGCIETSLLVIAAIAAVCCQANGEVELTSAISRNYTTDSRHLVLLHGYQLAGNLRRASYSVIYCRDQEIVEHFPELICKVAMLLLNCWSPEGR